jgi:dTDP-4-dehydrorhamnose 3,5-epimerase
VHGDNRGWFKENWQRQKMVALGLPDFGPVQNNISFNAKRGTTRGIHAEPWDKFISIGFGSIFGAWVDLREGPAFGTVFTTILRPDQAIYVPRGVGNAFQTLEDWSADRLGEYSFVNLADPTVGIDWPIPLDECELSERDLHHPLLPEAKRLPARRPLVLGANGQLGRALRQEFPEAAFADRTALDITSPDLATAFDWSTVDTVINAAAYTKVDAAETPEGRRAAWQINATATARLAEICRAHRITLVTVSSDYVFDGTSEEHDEDEAVSPLGVYGQTKAAAETIAATLDRQYTVRTSWVIGDGSNFVRTMLSLASRRIRPSVVDDQFGRLTFASTLAAAIRHLLESHAQFGTYNVSNGGPVMSWADIAKRVYGLAGNSPDAVTGVSTAEYFADKPHAPRPAHSALRLDKLARTGFHSPDADTVLTAYVGAELEQPA